MTGGADSIVNWRQEMQYGQCKVALARARATARECNGQRVQIYRAARDLVLARQQEAILCVSFQLGRYTILPVAAGRFQLIRDWFSTAFLRALP